MLNNSTTTNLVNAIRYAVKAERTYAAFVTENSVTKNNALDFAKELAAAAFKVGPVTIDGKRTDYGNAVNTAKTGLIRNLPVSEEDESDDETTLAVQALLTKAGFAATREQVIAAWESAQV